MLSPSTRGFDQAEKRAVCAREWFSHLWFVDPGVRVLEAFELGNGVWVLLTTPIGGAAVSLPPFDAVSFPLDATWSENMAAASEEDGGQSKCRQTGEGKPAVHHRFDQRTKNSS